MWFTVLERPGFRGSSEARRWDRRARTPGSSDARERWGFLPGPGYVPARGLLRQLRKLDQGEAGGLGRNE